MKRSQKMQTQSNGIARVSSIGNVGRVPAASATKVRRGFTLVELLVVISIIGILIGLLAVTLGPVLRRVQDGAVTVEMQQLDLAIENFKNQYGFYPPNFTQFDNAPMDSGTYDATAPQDSDAAAAATTDHLQLLPFLNKISPNHRENSGGAPTRLQVWWINIGRHLDERSSLVFWLTGLSANKQFPLTGNLPTVGGQVQLPVTYGGSQSIFVTANGSANTTPTEATDGTDPIGIPRDSLFTFKNDQLVDEAFDLTANTTVNLPAGIRVYNSPYGDTKPNKENAYSYVNSGAYDATRVPGFPFYTGTMADPVYINSNTFQIYTFGEDGLAENVVSGVAGNVTSSVNADNITNFANGRLETFDIRANLGL